MRKIVLDTNVYIGWLNFGVHEDLFLGTGWVRYLCAVVVMELRVGATTPSSRKALAGLCRAYEKGGRLIAPSVALYEHAGSVLAQLKERGHSIGRAAVVHDVLIALTARSIGATVITCDVKDFTAIASVVDVSWEQP